MLLNHVGMIGERIMKSIKYLVIGGLVASLIGCGNDAPSICIGYNDGVSRTANVVKTDCAYVAVPIPTDVKNNLLDSGFNKGGLNLNGTLLANALRQEVILRISEIESKSKDSKEPQNKDQKAQTSATASTIETVDTNKPERSQIISELKHAEEERLKAQVKLDKLNLDDKERIAEMYNELEHLKQQIYNTPTQPQQ